MNGLDLGAVLIGTLSIRFWKLEARGWKLENAATEVVLCRLGAPGSRDCLSRGALPCAATAIRKIDVLDFWGLTANFNSWQPLLEFWRLEARGWNLETAGLARRSEGPSFLIATVVSIRNWRGAWSLWPRDAVKSARRREEAATVLISKNQTIL